MEIKGFVGFCIFYFLWKEITLSTQKISFFKINTFKQITKSGEAR